MTALTGDILYNRRGMPGRNEFAYPVAPGEKVFRGSLCAVNAAGQLQRIQTAGGVAFVGMADRTLDNTTGATALSQPPVTALKGCWGIAVPTATFANIGATVYASDDQTLSLVNTGGTLLAVGYITGIENGLTYVMFTGS